ncbi:MAG: YdcF family protein [Blastocatellia bacterium]|nr:YdcF family protein [Blastocatellia bacterium]
MKKLVRQLVRQWQDATRRKRMITVGVLLVCTCGLFVVGLNWWTRRNAAGRVFHQVAAVPDSTQFRIALVFGAGIWPNGQPSPVLYDRVATAVDLYKAGKVRKLLMTGDNRFHSYNEPEVMKNTAVRLGVPETDIVLDFAGRRTYDSCYRAKHIFGVKQVVLVSQEFHLGRALYLSDSMGLPAIGVTADRQSYSRSMKLSWEIREIAAITGAWVDLNLWAPRVILGEKIPIE